MVNKFLCITLIIAVSNILSSSAADSDLSQFDIRAGWQSSLENIENNLNKLTISTNLPRQENSENLNVTSQIQDQEVNNSGLCGQKMLTTDIVSFARVTAFSCKFFMPRGGAKSIIFRPAKDYMTFDEFSTNLRQVSIANKKLFQEDDEIKEILSEGKPITADNLATFGPKFVGISNLVVMVQKKKTII